MRREQKVLHMNGFEIDIVRVTNRLGKNTLFWVKRMDQNIFTGV